MQKMWIRNTECLSPAKHPPLYPSLAPGCRPTVVRSLALVTVTPKTRPLPATGTTLRSRLNSDSVFLGNIPQTREGGC
jgi:hypothetical protein